MKIKDILYQIEEIESDRRKMHAIQTGSLSEEQICGVLELIDDHLDAYITLLKNKDIKD